MTVYGQEFYDCQRDASLRSARIIAPILCRLFAPRSVIDFGCGLGCWLQAMRENGVLDVHGVEGAWVQSQHTVLDKRLIETADLACSYRPAKRYDLALCLEVAEHLPETTAATFIGSLCAASDVLVFSAAVPGQGGTDHKNEQWPDYWVARFKTNGYTGYDILRPIVWDLPVEPWYAQNILLFTKEALPANTIALANQMAVRKSPLNLVHPKFFEAVRTPAEPSVRSLMVELSTALSRSIGRRCRKIMGLDGGPPTRAS